MKQAAIQRIAQAVDWTELPVIPIDYQRKPVETGIRAFAQICYDAEQLRLHMWAEEPCIRAEVTDPLGQVCQDSCLEFFFRPDPEDLRYFNVEINPNGCLFLGFGSCFEDLVRLHPLKSPIIPEIVRTDGGWELFYTVPNSFIRLFFPEYDPSPGAVLRANFYKCGDLTRIPHHFCWSPPAPRPHGFHCPEDFGTLRFE